MVPGLQIHPGSPLGIPQQGTRGRGRHHGVQHWLNDVFKVVQQTTDPPVGGMHHVFGQNVLPSVGGDHVQRLLVVDGARDFGHHGMGMHGHVAVNETLADGQHKFRRPKRVATLINDDGALNGRVLGSVGGVGGRKRFGVVTRHCGTTVLVLA